MRLADQASLFFLVSFENHFVFVAVHFLSTVSTPAAAVFVAFVVECAEIGRSMPGVTIVVQLSGTNVLADPPNFVSEVCECVTIGRSTTTDVLPIADVLATRLKLLSRLTTASPNYSA